MTTLTLEQVRDSNMAKGFHWFDPDTIEAFACEIDWSSWTLVDNGEAGLFISSEQDTSDFRYVAWDGERRYTIRKGHRNGSVDTIGAFGEYMTHAEAKEALQKLVLQDRSQQ